MIEMNITNRTSNDFSKFSKMVYNHFKEMCEVPGVNLYEVEVDKDEMWNLYLDSFPAGTNEIYRERRKHDCNTCKHFMRRVGNVVAIINSKVVSIWDVEPNDTTFSVVTKALSDYVHKHKIIDAFYSDTQVVGCEFNYENTESGETNKYEHFHAVLTNEFVKRKDDIASLKGNFRDKRNVFKRSLDEFTKDALDSVKELIESNTLYRGEEWKVTLSEFTKYYNKYHKLNTDEEKELFAWDNANKVGVAVSKIRNHSFGTLLTDVSNGVPLDKAVTSYEKIVAPSNYKRPKAIFTKKMLEDAQKTITELGYIDSLQRRFAKLDDITVNNILFSNKDSAKRIQGGNDLFASMEKDITVNPKKFSKVEEIGIDDFVKNVLPYITEVEAFVENKHAANMCSLIAPVNNDAKTMFKWNNNFGWAYTGNMTDSLIKEHVKAAGGKVDGVLRFSIQWNDENDLDAHCIEPNGNHIYFGTNKKPYFSALTGQLDVDVMHPVPGTHAVENITWSNKARMIPGVYKFWVNQYANRGGRHGFKAEIEFDGQIYSFEYDKELRTSENVYVAEVTLHEDGTFTIKELLLSTTASKEVWGIHTNQFIPVSVICYSPNYWDEQSGNGNKHYMFMLKDCVNSEEPNGFYNEFLNNELAQHKRVLEALGSKAHVEDTEDQLSGLGFSSTKRNELIVKVKGSTERVMKIKF